ncbi:delta 1-pyrroline-5-carboxylate reductase [Lobaria immixta]|nr:delta 1-pyrroline-5-carboxylate reductase [Lobaria immixta]
MEEQTGETLTVLGCGTLGIAILSGIIQSLRDNTSSSTSSPLPAGIPTHFIACVTRDASAKRIHTALGPLKYPLQICISNNLEGARSASIVLLACKPQHLRTVVSEPGIAQALRGKLLISILAGVPVTQIQDVLQEVDPDSPEPCTVIRVMPNTAALIRESMTVIASSVPPLSKELYELVTWIFTSIGRVVHLPPTTMDVSTALCGSGPAFFALMLESMTDGAVAMGLPRAEAQLMAAQTMKGCAGLVLNGEHPAMVREKVCTPGGCSIGGLMVLEEGKVRGTLARGVREATVVAAELGKGVQGVNGTRF